MTQKSKQDLCLEIQSQWPDLKPQQITKLVDTYLEVLADQLLKNIQYSQLNYQGQMEYQISLEAINEACGQIGRRRASTYFKNIHVINIKYKGNIGKQSRVTIDTEYHDLVRDEMHQAQYRTSNQTAIKKMQEQEDQEDQDAFQVIDTFEVSVPMNIWSMVDYLEDNEIRQQNPYNDEYLNKLQSNYRVVKTYLENTKDSDGLYPETAQLSETWRQIDSGRTYATGSNNLQSSREIRHAILGPCVKYDFCAASYAILHDLARLLAQEKGITWPSAWVQQYIVDRSAIRQQIAHQMGMSTDLIKQVFAAIGFGARYTSTPRTAIGRLLGSRKDDFLSINTPLINVREFLEEVELIRDIILDDCDFGSDYFEVSSPWADSDSRVFVFKSQLPPTNPREQIYPISRKPSQRLAWIYQAFESHALDQLRSLVTRRFGQEVLYTAHDCVYVRGQLTGDQLFDLNYYLKQNPIFRNLRVDCEKIRGFNTTNRVEQEDQQAALELRAHRQRIAQEERAAENYVPGSGLITISNTHARLKKRIQIAGQLIEVDHDF